MALRPKRPAPQSDDPVPAELMRGPRKPPIRKESRRKRVGNGQG
jgi:hypothetical protein